MNHTEAAKYIYGTRFKVALAKELGVDRKTVYHWFNGDFEPIIDLDGYLRKRVMEKIRQGNRLLYQ